MEEICKMVQRELLRSGVRTRSRRASYCSVGPRARGHARNWRRIFGVPVRRGLPIQIERLRRTDEAMYTTAAGLLLLPTRGVRGGKRKWEKREGWDGCVIGLATWVRTSFEKSSGNKSIGKPNLCR